MNKIYANIDKLRNNNKVRYFFNSLSFISIVYLLYLIDLENINFSKLLNYTTIFIFILISFFYFSFAGSWSALIERKFFNKRLIILWLSSVIGKYIPTGLGVPLLRFEKLDKYEDNNSKIIILSTIKELVYTLLSCIFICFLFFFEIYVGMTNFTFFTLITISLVYIIYRYVSKKNINFFNFLITHLFLIILLSYLSYAQFQTIRIEFILVYILSSIISILAIGVPAGLGIKELAFIQILSMIGSAEGAIEFITFARIYFVFFDLILFFLIRFYRRVLS